MKHWEPNKLTLDAFGAELAPDARFDVKITGMTCEGDRVAAEAASYAPPKSGMIYNNKYNYLFELRDGKVAEVKEYNYTHHARKTIGSILKNMPAPNGKQVLADSF